MKITINIPDQVYQQDPAYKKYFEALQMMVNRMAVSHYKYGKINGNGPAVDELKSGLQRAAMYDTRYLKSKKIWQGRTPKPLNTGNTENLIDAANFMLLEYMFPKHRDAEFEAQPSSASPGLAKAG
jgi:hypothetical protein